MLIAFVGTSLLLVAVGLLGDRARAVERSGRGASGPSRRVPSRTGSFRPRPSTSGMFWRRTSDPTTTSPGRRRRRPTIAASSRSR